MEPEDVFLVVSVLIALSILISTSISSSAQGIAFAGSSTNSTAQPTGNVTFSESGLPNGAPWSVYYSNESASASAPNTISVPNTYANYSYIINKVIYNGTTYIPSSSSGLVIPGQNVLIYFTVPSPPPLLQNVTFSESGLPIGAIWSVNYNGINTSAYAPGAITVPLSHANYTFIINRVFYNGTAYIPSTSSGAVASGENVLILFTGPKGSSAPGSSSVSSILLAHLGNGLNSGSGSVANSMIDVYLKQSALTSVLVNLTVATGAFNISIINQSTPINGQRLAASPVYQYIQANGTVTSTNIDNFATNVTYNFAVPVSWIRSQGINYTDIKLFKYNQSAGWLPLSTTPSGANSTSYFYTASSASFSYYAIGFTTGSTGTTSTYTITLDLNSGYPFYFFGGSAHQNTGTDTLESISWTNVTNSVTAAHGKNVTMIGYQGSDQGTFRWVQTTGTRSLAIAGVGANVSLTNGKQFVSNSVDAADTLSWSVANSNSYAILIVSESGYETFTETYPATGCAIAQNAIYVQSAYHSSFVQVQVCNSIAAGSYSTTLTPKTTTASVVSMAAWVFPPYSVTFNSLNGGSVVEGGTTLINQTDMVIGTAPLNATVPNGYAFAGWVVNSPYGGINFGNIIIANSASSNTFITVIGNGIVTATFAPANYTTFTEAGLNSGQTWNVVYDGVTESSDTNQIAFPNIPQGQYSFTIANQTGVNGNVFQALPGSGTLAADQSLNFTFYSTYHASYINSNNIVTVDTPNNASLVYPTNSLLHRIRVRLNTKGITYNVMLSNGISAPSGIPAYGESNTYQYFTVQGNVTSTGKNVDANIVRATYNFTVPVGWVNGNTTEPDQITIFKYYAGQGWVPLTTNYHGTNGTAYFYNATSSSFSTYVVATVTNFGTSGTAGNYLLDIGHNEETYLFVGAGQLHGSSSPSLTTNLISTTSNTNEKFTTTFHLNASIVGNTPSWVYFGNYFLTSGETLYNTVIGGIGANVLIANANVVTNAVSTNTFALAYNVPVSNSVVFLFIAASGNAISSPTLLSGCTKSVYEALQNASVWIANCIQGPSTGNFVVTTTLGNTLKSHVAMVGVAYIFPPYTVTFNDLPSSGNIISNGITLNSGGSQTAIGLSTINAIQAPSGNYVFGGWTFTAPTGGATSNFILYGNTAVSNTLSANAYLSIMGNGIVTASWNSIWVTLSVSNSLIDQGQNQIVTATVSNAIPALPLTYNFLVYNSLGLVANYLWSNALGTNTLAFTENANNGIGLFTINVIVTNTLYNPSVSVSNTITYGVNTALGSVTLTPSNVLCDNGQTVTYTTSWSGGGTPPYNVIFYNYTHGSTIAAYNGITLTSNTYILACRSTSNGLQRQYQAFVYDSATSNAEKQSSINTITLYVYPVSTQWSLSPNPASPGAQEVLTAAWQTGVSPYVANYVIYSSTGSQLANELYVGPASPNTFTFTQQASWGYGPFTANIAINDSATTNGQATNSLTFVVGPTITLANTIYGGNQIDVVANSASDNALVTATCVSTSTCQIWYGGASQASGTGSTALAYNTLSLGFTSLYANDLGYSLTSADSLVNRIALFGNTTITFTNGQQTSVASDTPISFTVNALNFTGWESSTLNNSFVYFNNGTVGISWLQGNVFNELAWANTLENSNEVLFWLESPESTSWLAGSSGTATVNLGFSAVNINILDGNFIGEAPQISCTLPANTVTGCAAGEYGEFDTGNNMFQFYDNFTGTSLNPVWSTFGTTKGNIIINNGLTISQNTLSCSGCDVGVYMQYTALPNNGIYGTLLNATKLNVGAVKAGDGFGFSTIAPTTALPYPYNGYLASLGSSSNLAMNVLSFTSAASTNLAGASDPLTSGYAYGSQLLWYAQGASRDLHYTDLATSNTVTVSSSTYLPSSTTNTLLEVGQVAASSSNNIGRFQYFYIATAPPNGIMPSVSYNPTSNKLTTCGIQITNALLGPGNLNPGSNTPFTSNLVVDTNFGGVVSANIIVDGSSWVYDSNSYYVSNTAWSPSNIVYTSGTALMLDPGNFIDTLISIPGGASNSIYFGFGVPPGEPSGTFTQNIVIENLC